MNAIPSIERAVGQVTGCTPTTIPSWVLDSSMPLVLKGLVADWPLAQAARESVEEADAYLRQFDQGKPITAYCGKPEMGGRIFYNDAMTGFNFQPASMPLLELLDQLLAHRHQDEPPTFYMGSTMADVWFPGFRADNDLLLEGVDPLVSLWIGNRTRVAAHNDFPDNIACSVVGRRKFTLFPPEQLPNLYIGPLEATPSGRPISMVDFHHPDFTRFPNFREALASAQVAELEPGDALFIPSLWWHHVESLDAYNVLVNYWWRSTPSYMGQPASALDHAILTIRNLPEAQRKAWQSLFEHYVFKADPNDLQHIPEANRGRLGPMSELTARKLRAELLNKLNR